MTRTYETHKYAEMFPNMASDEFDELVKDIRQNGLIEPITMLEGKVLDGRSRLKACGAAGVEAKLVEFDGDDPLAFVWAKNFARRHLTLHHRVTLALKFKGVVEAAAKERQSKGGKISVAIRAISSGQDATDTTVTPVIPEAEKGRTVDKLAELADVSRGTMQAALVVDREAPELLADIEAGKLSVSAAAKAVKERKTATADGTDKPKGDWKKVEAYAEKLNAELSAIELSGGPDSLDVVDVLQTVADRIGTLLQRLNKKPVE